MPRLATPSNRPRALELLGSRCSLCGFNSDERVLQFNREGGTAELLRRTLSKERYYLRIIGETMEAQRLGIASPWRLLCLNCKFISMYDTALATSAGATTTAEGMTHSDVPVEGGAIVAAMPMALASEKQSAAAATPPTIPFVWRTDLTLPELRNKTFAWLDKYEREGRKVFIALNEGAGEVRAYGTLAVVAPSIEVFEETNYGEAAA